jgi:membrane-bound inhibitor of C-type lysozyme
VLAIALGFGLAEDHVAKVVPNSQVAVAPANASAPVRYSCTQGIIDATFTDNQVVLALSDGRHLTLPQTMSGSGTRYAQGLIVFSGKGSSATLTENSKATYENCISGSDVSGDATTSTFTDTGKTFSFSHPIVFAVTGGDGSYSQDWATDSMHLGLMLARVVIPQTFMPKTNFGDARFVVGTSADATAVKECLAPPQGNGVKSTKVTINGVAFQKLVFAGAGAGNFYDTTSYRTLRNGQCYSVEYTIHSGNIGNYSPDQGIKAFNDAKIRSVLESIAQSFTFL